VNKLFIIIILFLTSCSSNLNKKNFNFSDEMSFNEFKKRLLEYSETNPYPNIDY